MRFLLALILTLPAMAQAPAAKPEQKAPAAAEEKKAESPVPSAEQWLSGSIDFGYRWLTDIRGSSDTYRSVVNLGEGPKLTGADFTLTDPKKRAFDRVDVRALGWGGDPYNTAHVDARKRGVYDFRFDYRNIAYFNSLPSFANPLLPKLVSERAMDTHRRMSSFDLSLMPGKRIVPYVAYSSDGGRGRGAGTFYTEGNEYSVPSVFSDHTNNIRGGVRLEFNRYHLTLEQGATSYSDDQKQYETQRNAGNRTSLLGPAPLSLTSLGQLYAITADGIYSKVQGTARPANWIDLFGQFLYSQPKTTSNYSDSATGNFVVLTSLLFYNGQQALSGGLAKAPHTMANGGFEIRPVKRLRIVESITTDRLHNAAAGFLTETLLLGTTRQPLTAALNDRLVMNINQQQIDAIYDLSRRITLRGGYRYEWGDTSVRTGTLSQSGPFEASELKRNVGLAGVNVRALQKLSFNLDYEGASTDRSYFRTSLYDYHRARLRARYQAFGALAFQGSYSLYNNENPSPGVKYDFQSRDFSLAAFWTPAGGKRVSLTGEYSRSTLRSDINYLVPQQLSTQERSFYRDNAHTATSLMDVALPGYAGLTPKLSLGGSLFVSSGSRASRYYQPLARLSLPLQKHVYWNSEWRWYGFGEQFYFFEGFRAHTFMTGLRLVR